MFRSNNTKSTTVLIVVAIATVMIMGPQISSVGDDSSWPLVTFVTHSTYLTDRLRVLSMLQVGVYIQNHLVMVKYVKESTS